MYTHITVNVLDLSIYIMYISIRCHLLSLLYLLAIIHDLLLLLKQSLHLIMIFVVKYWELFFFFKYWELLTAFAGDSDDIPRPAFALQFIGPIGSLCLPITIDLTNQNRLSFPLALGVLAASYSRCRRCLCIPCVSGQAGASSDWDRVLAAPQPLRCWMLSGLSPLTHLVTVPQEDWPRQYCKKDLSSSRKARWALWPPDIPT